MEVTKEQFKAEIQRRLAERRKAKALTEKAKEGDFLSVMRLRADHNMKFRKRNYGRLH